MHLAAVYGLKEPASEFQRLAKSITSIFIVVDKRIEKLREIFEARSQDTDARMAQFALGMFQLTSAAHPRYPLKNTIRTFTPKPEFTSTPEDVEPEFREERSKRQAVKFLEHGIIEEEANIPVSPEFSLVNHHTIESAMFSRGNHHDPHAPADLLARPTHTNPKPQAGDSPAHTSTISAHYSRLESLLDSALATLTLIHDHDPIAAPPLLNGHMIAVLQVG
ncbi:hypothetical protein FB45DRAFT_1086050 [Roridomyces roridus]|uniref:Uncharacterized protein n=1 Tax=Roridomyces roridus TaxID=1738132 RepID=A0AAD7BL24_9AGAR|nr:hypothetical protein FB45DRAFT_1086050 [Roridomyces roridus]